MVAVIAFGHFLETATGETTLDIGGDVGIVGFLVGRWCHPGLLDLEVMWYIDLSPLALIVKSELPTEVKTLDISLRGSSQRNEKKQT